MDKQNIRLIFLFVLFFVGMFLFNAWQEEHSIKQSEQAVELAAKQSAQAQAHDLPLMDAAPKTVKKTEANELPIITGKPKLETQDASRLVTVVTDTLNLKIDAMGGDVVELDLPKYPQTLQNTNEGFLLFAENAKRFYVAQSGLLSDVGPDSVTNGRALYNFAMQKVVMQPDESVLNVDFNYITSTGAKIVKRFIFERGSYVVRIQYLIDNKSPHPYQASSFGRLKRRAPTDESSGFFGAMKTYTGAAINTPETKYKKIPFGDMIDKPYKEDVKGGWAAMVEHYFASAFVPPIDERNYYQTESFGDGMFGIRFVSEETTVAPGEQKTIEVKLYAGPEIASHLKQLAPGLELTIDYGVLWFLCQPIFWLLKTMFELFKNWGVAIIFTTVIIKGLFYKLSASSYKSMGNMRKLQPKIEALKKRFGEDKQKFSQAMMDLYKSEKINPLGGCLPIVVQIPVFIALYYVLLECVELRQAPFMLWIQDLSAKDPYYVLPVIMGASMFVQQRLNPTPPDPIQAKVMMFMPLFFTFLFLQFPSGLVLYWVVNNVLSILQQWMITRKIERAGK
jgi:YidC/Oxa1 family membrane protein insertase